MKKCCHQKCITKKQKNEGYNVAFGFMLWACPAHSLIWQNFDKKNKKYEKNKSLIYEKDYAIWETTWHKEYAKRCPNPQKPRFQSSMIKKV